MNPVSLGGRRGLEGIKFRWEAEGIQWEAHWNAERLQRAREQMRAWLWGTRFPIPWSFGTGSTFGMLRTGSGGGGFLVANNTVVVMTAGSGGGGGVGSSKRWIDVQGAKIVETLGEM